MTVAADCQLSERVGEHTAEIDLEHLIGGVYSALSTDHLPAPEQRPKFAEQIRQALHPVDRFSEHVRVMMLIGQKDRLADAAVRPTPAHSCLDYPG
ncbi:hypothetical protein [Micromonospora sp. Llam0]|uniref:hypothetical protein n=1 Tax=Micromonospora sp. Llam0 TaxID=2485143 RepID=UPI0011CE1767|nr:hypothetical protein [Micromonospora sp. Llam0]